MINTINGSPIKWDDGKVIHRVEGDTINFPQNPIRLLWTKCDKDVPANKAFTGEGDVNCPKCMEGDNV